jgi:hypothetical protein
MMSFDSEFDPEEQDVRAVMHLLWGTLKSVKRAGSHLFLRYAFATKETTI